MITKAKSNSVITHEVSNDRYVTFTVLGVGNLTLDITAMHANNQARAMVHGMIQRISDAAAISRDPETGESATAQDKFDAMQRLVAHYESGTSEWSRRPVAGEGKSGGLLFKALCIMSAETKSPDEIREWMSTKTKAQLSALRATERVATIIATLRPASIEVDADALMEELNG